MDTELNIIRDIIHSRPSTFVKPREFYIAWSGVPTLAFRGFSTALLEIKSEIEGRIPRIKEENPGTRWPKTTLGALRDDKKLSWKNVCDLRTVCDELNEEIAGEDRVFNISQLSVVVFQCRSLEKRLVTFPIALAPRMPKQSDDPPQEHLDEVEAVMREFARSRLRAYWPDLQRDGNRESHYRITHIEPTIVYDWESQQPGFVEEFIRRVDEALPGFYCWFDKDSRHMTVRGLTSA